MIIISNDDLPITVAQKIITGTKAITNDYTKAVSKLVGGDGTQDMFSIEEIKEIADYLLVYCNSNDD